MAAPRRLIVRVLVFLVLGVAALLAACGCKSKQNKATPPQAQASLDEPCAATQELFAYVSSLTTTEVSAMDWDTAGAALMRLDKAEIDAHRIGDSELINAIQQKRRAVLVHLVNIRDHQ